MSGVHWRADNINGNRQDEAVALRILPELKKGCAEPFDGRTVTI